MEIVIRPFEPDDMDGLFFLDQRCHSPESQLPYNRMLATLLEKDITAIVAVEKQVDYSTRLSGAMILQAEPWARRLFVLILMIDPGLRRAGIASKLLTWAELIGQGAGFQEMAFAGDSDQDGVLTGLGFSRAEGRSLSYRSGAEEQEWVRTIPEAPKP